ncbi:sulfurtransferase TusA family protein [Lachnospiraceae bacterium LCP25S3_G4]
MKVIDARGLSCPEPLMMTQDALKENQPLKVLVSEPHQKMNVEKLAKSQGKTTKVMEVGSEFEIIIE